MRGPVGIDGREYKLLLEPKKFAGAPFEESAADFWTQRLKPLIGKTLDDRDRAKGKLQLPIQREVMFLDTRGGVLARRGFALRKRTTVANDVLAGTPEWTLKFRTPDFLLAAEYCRVAQRFAKDDTKLEEDIAPLQVSRGPRKPVAVPKPRSVYSRYSVSTKLVFDEPLAALGDVFKRFGGLEKSLKPEGDADLKLISGATIAEWVFRGAAVDLGKNLDARFSLTFWSFFPADDGAIPRTRVAEDGHAPSIAEISFDFLTKGGRMPAPAAERASRLFIAVQKRLPVNKHATSKTALGLPPAE